VALRRFLFQSLSSTTSFLDSSEDTDDVRFNSITIAQAANSGTAINVNTNDVTNVRKLYLVTGDGTGVAQDCGGYRITALATPTGATDAANKSYVDAAIAGFTWKAAVRAASTANVTISGPGTAIDGVTLSNGDRVLLKNQSTASQNGIYAFNGAASAMTLTSDAVAGEVFSGDACFVTQGTANAGTGWILTTPNPITVGTTSQTWTQFSSTSQVSAGNGLSLAGNVMSAVAGNGIAVGASIAVQPLTNGGITVASGGVSVTAGAGIAVGAGGVAISLAASSGLNTTSGLAIGAGNGIAVGASTISVAPNTAQGVNVSGSGVGLTLAGTNPGLAFTSTYVDVKYDPARGITAGASGIGLALAGTPGLTLSGNALAVLIDATTTGGLALNANGVCAKLNGSTLAVTAGAGLSVLGVPAAGTWQIGGVATSANVTAANLGTLTAGSATDASALHTHANLAAASSSAVLVPITAGTGGLAKGNPLYLSANNTALVADPSSAVKSIVVGLASAAISQGAGGYAQRDGILAGVGSSWTYGQQIFLGTAGALTNNPTTLASRSRTIQLGVAVNATDLLVSIQDYGMTP